MKCPDGLIKVDNVSERVGKSRPFRDGGRNCRFQEIHGGRTPYLDDVVASILPIGKREGKKEYVCRRKRDASTPAGDWNLVGTRKGKGLYSKYVTYACLTS